MKTRVILIITVLFVAAACCERVFSEGEREYVIGMHLDSGSGIASSKAYQFADSLFMALEKEHGFKFRIKKYSSLDEAREEFVKGSVDIVQVWPEDALYIREAGGEIEPFLSYKYGKKDTRPWCLWHQSGKGPDGEGNIDIVGKTLLIPGHKKYISYIILREFLFEKGIDRPLWEVFPTFTKINSTNSAMMALSLGKADFLWESYDLKYFKKLLNSTLKIKHSRELCTEPVYDRSFFGINRKTVSVEEMRAQKEAMRESLLRMDELAKKYPELQSYMAFVKMIDMDMIPAKEKPFEKEFELYEKAKKNGWLDEARYVAGAIKNAAAGRPFEIKPDMDYCKKKCGKKNDCVLECLE